jgi:hypothetical protein
MALPPTGALMGTITCWSGEEGMGPGWGAAAGFNLGTVAGMLMAGQSLTGGALGLNAALLGRTRVRSYGLALIGALLLLAVDLTVGGIVGLLTAWAMLGRGAYGATEVDQGFLTAMSLVVVGLVVARVWLVNLVLTTRIMPGVARDADQLLLGQG